MKKWIVLFCLVTASIGQAQVAWLSQPQFSQSGTALFETSRTVEFCRFASRARGCVGKIAAQNIEKEKRIDLVQQAIIRVNTPELLRELNVEVKAGASLEILKELYESRFRRDENLLPSLEAFVQKLSGLETVFIIDRVYAGGPGYEEWDGSPNVYDPISGVLYLGRLHYHGGED